MNKSGVQLKESNKIALLDFCLVPPTAMFVKIVVGCEVSLKFNLVLPTHKYLVGRLANKIR